MTTLVFAILAFGVFTIGGAIGVIMGLEMALYGMKKEQHTSEEARDILSQSIDAYLVTRDYNEYDEAMNVPAYERERLMDFVDFLITKADGRQITK